MIPLAADENFHSAIIRGVKLRNPALDIVRVQDVGLSRASDPIILEWAASESRPLLTHDVNTMVHYAEKRIASGLWMAGLILVPQPFAMARIIEDVQLIAECGKPEELDGTWFYLPLR